MASYESFLSLSKGSSSRTVNGIGGRGSSNEILLVGLIPSNPCDLTLFLLAIFLYSLFYGNGN